MNTKEQEKDRDEFKRLNKRKNTMKTQGIERVSAHLQARIYEALEKYQEAIPKDLNECRTMQEIIAQASIGQLLTLCNLDDRWKTFKIHSCDESGTIFITTCGLYGGMDLDGFIHT